MHHFNLFLHLKRNRNGIFFVVMRTNAAIHLSGAIAVPTKHLEVGRPSPSNIPVPLSSLFLIPQSDAPFVLFAFPVLWHKLHNNILGCVWLIALMALETVLLERKAGQ